MLSKLEYQEEQNLNIKINYEERYENKILGKVKNFQDWLRILNTWILQSLENKTKSKNTKNIIDKNFYQMKFESGSWDSPGTLRRLT